MNKENKYPHLTEWCKHYYEKSGLKVHPSSVPTDVVLDDLMGQLMASLHTILTITNMLEEIAKRVIANESEVIKIKHNIEDIKDIIKELTPLETKVIKPTKQEKRTKEEK